MVKVSASLPREDTLLSLPRIPKSHVTKDKVKRLGVSHPVSDTVNVVQLRQYLHPVGAAGVRPKVNEKDIAKAIALMELQESSDSKGDNTDLVMPECTKCELCVSRGEDHKSKDIFCKCSVCETLPKKAPKIFYKNEKVKIILAGFFSRESVAQANYNMLGHD